MTSSLTTSVNIQAQIDKALQSNNLSEYLTAIALCGQAIRDNPFPSYVNNLLSRLTEIFQGDKIKMEQSLNLIRLRIIKLLKECEADLSVVASSSFEDIVRRIMKVSHSNDYKTRSLAMLFLAAAAPIVYENKKVHHLISEGLDCKDRTELMSVIKATGAIGHFSLDFSSAIIENIGSLLLKEEIDMQVKRWLMENLSIFQENYVVTKYCMKLGRKVLEEEKDQKFNIAMINALTSVCRRNGVALGEHVNLVLDQIARIDKNEDLLICCLTNLLSLAESPQNWNIEQITRLCQYRDNVCVYASFKPAILWLQSLNLLIKYTLAQSLLTVELFDHLAPLSTIKNFSIKIHLVDVLYWLLQRVQSLERAQFLFACMNEITAELGERNCAIDLKDRSKFYKMLATYIRNNNSSTVAIDPLEVSTFLTKIDDTYPEEVFTKSLETLNLICDIKVNITGMSCNWALQILKKKYGKLNQKQLTEAPLELYSLALRPNNAYADKVNVLIKNVQQELSVNKNWWFGYKLARQALRYGHFSNIALPLLEQIQLHCDTVEISSFIRALIYISKSQLPKNFDANSLNETRQNLRYASLLLTPLVKTSKNSQCFAFAANFIDCLYELYGAFNTVLVTLNSNMGYLPTANKIHHMEYIKISFDKAREEFHAVRQKWIELLQKSFDVDETTQQQLDFFSRYCLLFESILTRLFASDVHDLTAISKLEFLSTNRRLEDLLRWGIENTNKNIHAVTGPLTDRVKIWKNNFVCFATIFSYLAEIPLYLPRACFQQLCRTKIRLNVTPQPKEQQALSLSTKQLAMSVEGMVETNNPKSIQSITVYVHVYMDNSTEPTIIDSRLIQLFDNYFKVNFLLTIAKNAEIVTSVRFTDSVNKQTWEANEENRFNVHISVPTQ